MRRYEFTERGKIFIAILLVLLLLVLPSAILAFKVMASDTSPPVNGQYPGTLGETPSIAGPQPPEATDETPPSNGGDFNQTDPPESNGEATPGESHTPDAGDDDDIDATDNGNGVDAQPGNNGENAEASPNSPDTSPGTQPPPDGGSSPDGQDAEDGREIEPPEPPGWSEPALSSGILTFSFSPGTQTTLDNRTVSLISEFLKSSKNTKSSIIVIETPRLTAQDADTLTQAVKNAFTSKGVSVQRLEFTPLSATMTGLYADVKIFYIETNTNGK